MIERIIENWLDKSSERSYQLPFCYMLIAQGKTIVHLTRHNAMEHGKDIIAKDEKGNIYAYQLKGLQGGKLKLRDWQSIFPQLFQLAVSPLTHPSALSEYHHTSYLVLNGEIEEEVFNAINTYNADHRSKGQGQYQINTIVRGEILAWAYSLKDQLIPTELKEVKSLLEFYLHNGEGFLDKAAFSTLLRSILWHEPKSLPEIKRSVSSAALLCAIALNQYQEKNNYVAIIEGWTIYIATILWFAEEYQVASSLYNEELLLADRITINALQELTEECLLSKDLLQGNLGTDLLVFKHRVTIMFGLLAYYGQRVMSDESLSKDYIPKLNTFFEQHSAHTSAWGEGAIPFLVNAGWYFKITGQPDKEKAILKNLLLRCAAEFKLNKESLFTNYYLSAEDTILILLDEKKDTHEIEVVTDTRHVTETILYLLTRRDEKEFLQQHWKTIADFSYLDFEFAKMSNIYLWRCEKGKEITLFEKEKEEWVNLQRRASTINLDKMPKRLQLKKEFIPLFLMIYPHRFKKDIVLFIDESM